MTSSLEPFRLDPVLVERPWGGRRLERFGKRLPTGVAIGESWEVADLPDHVAPTVADPRSRVATGPHRGASLGELIASRGEDLLGPVTPTAEGRFPLLVKLLDAREHLSIQVHPHAGYVADHPEARLKTESWYVMEADAGSELFIDVAEGVTIDDVKAVMGSPDIVPLLATVPGRPGDFHHVPAGLIHSLGAGLLVAEVQTPSDTTFRIYDWAVEYGRAPRPLHPEEALASIRIHPEEAAMIPARDEPGTRMLTENEHYWIAEHRTEGGAIAFADAPGPRLVMVMRGQIDIEGLAVPPGATAVVPAAALGVTVGASGPATVLEVGLEPA